MKTYTVKRKGLDKNGNHYATIETTNALGLIIDKFFNIDPNVFKFEVGDTFESESLW